MNIMNKLLIRKDGLRTARSLLSSSFGKVPGNPARTAKMSVNQWHEWRAFPEFIFIIWNNGWDGLWFVSSSEEDNGALME